MTNGEMIRLLTRKYEKKKKPALFEPKIDDPELEFNEFVRKFYETLVAEGQIRSRKDVKALDTIDYSKTVDMKGESLSAMPSIRLTDQDFDELSECWQLIIPPLSQGVLRINRCRYLVYEVKDVFEERNEVGVEIYDYAYDKCWALENIVVGLYRWNRKDQSIGHAIRGVRLSEIADALVPELDTFTENEKLYMKMVVYPYLKSVEEEDDLKDVLQHFTLAMIKTNLQLLQGKPKAKRSSKAKITTVAGEAQKIPKPQVVRTLVGGIEVKSVKPPRIVTGEILRKYTLEAWNTRGHVRRYKSGKTVWIKPSVHHRKCLEKGAMNIVPQMIIKVQKEEKHEQS